MEMTLEQLRDAMSILVSSKNHFTQIIMQQWIDVLDEYLAAQAGRKRTNAVPSDEWFAEMICEARNLWCIEHEMDFLENDGIHIDEFVGKYVREALLAEIV